MKAFLGFFLGVISSVEAATYMVTSTNDLGAGSLRQAISDANNSAGPDVINFNIPGPGLTLTVTNPLPVITDPVTLDATTQPTFAGSPIVELNGAGFGSAQDGLKLITSNSIIRGLVVNRFTGDGIEITNGTGNTVEGCIIGLNVAGNSDLGNNFNGILVTNSLNTTIGGIYATQRNIISGNNGNGIQVGTTNSSGTLIMGNYIGLSANGATAIGNSQYGVFFINSSSNTIGSVISGGRNVISANGSSGVRIEGTNAFRNNVLGNYIGSDFTGTTNRGNGNGGVYVFSAGNNVIGGAAAGARNLLSGNNQSGVRLDGTTTRSNIVTGNFIGTDISGEQSRGNSAEGVTILNGASGNMIGGVAAGEGNTIAFNNGDGLVVLSNGTNNAIRGNTFRGNGGAGIDLENDGVTVNDAGDIDGNSNQRQNFPVITNGVISAGSTLIQGLLNSRPSSTYFLDFFSSVLPDNSSTNGEGQYYLGSLTVATGSDSNAAFGVALPVVATGRYLTATATDTNGNTSEFSTAYRAPSSLSPLSRTVINTNDAGAGSLRQALLDIDNTPANGLHTVSFNIPGGGIQVIGVSNALPIIVEPISLDGFTQPGSSSNTLSAGNNANWLIRLDGNSAGNGVNGLTFYSSSNLVRGLIITRFNGVGIEWDTNVANVIIGNSIGLDETGADFGNNSDGLFFASSASNRIGGTLPGDRNIISGNNGDGLEFSGSTASRNFILGNYIGLNPAGTLGRGNGSRGVAFTGAPDNTVGGTGFGAGNLISGNSTAIEINGVNSTNVVILGNFLGTEVTGTSNVFNSQYGVYVSGNARLNTIGGTNSGAGNRIAFSGQDGVYVQNGTNNAIRGNNIWSNSALGIDLDNDGVTVNDAGDPDTGANNRQNFPVITNAVLSAGSTLIQGAFNSRPSVTHNLDFFASYVRDVGSTNGEGEEYLGTAVITTGADSNATFNVNLPVTATAGRWITATATDPDNNTSEFSTAFRATSVKAGVTLTVLNTNNIGAGSLRQAIVDNNKSFSTSNNLIRFQIPGTGVQMISPSNQLPGITEPVLIDGYTQTGASSNSVSSGDNAVLLIRLDGAVAGGVDGLRLEAGNTRVRGLSITRFSSDGIEVLSSNNIIEGNFIGLDPTGTNALGNGNGILINGMPNTVIGGSTPAARNLIGGNFGDGIELFNLGSVSNVIQGNFIGTDASGTLDKGNNVNGVLLNNAPGNLIGGPAPTARNIISGNNNAGINFSGGTATNNQVLNNFLGTDVTGALSVGNGSQGIVMSSSASGNQVGSVGSGNWIAFNNGTGVFVASGTNNAVRANNIWSNNAMGIDLDVSGITANDPGDADGGANFRQNFPVITNAIISTGSTVIQGTLNSQPNSTFVLDFFDSFVRDGGTTNGEGQQYLGSVTINTSADSNATFNANLLVTAAAGRWLTATATDTNGNTSEFSTAVPAASLLPPTTFTVVNTNDSGAGSLRQAILDDNGTFSGTPNTIAFAIPGAGPHVIAPATELPFIVQPVIIDGYTQAGAAVNTLTNGDNAVLKIRLDGINTSFVNGLRLAAPGCTVRGLSLMRFGAAAIEISSAGQCAVEGCFVGLDTDGVTGFQTFSATGIYITSSSSNRLGGSLPAQRNLVGGTTNSAGIYIVGAGSVSNTIVGNFIGTDRSGSVPRPNYNGIIVENGRTNRIGGVVPGERNIISGNQALGVACSSASSVNRILGNFIGLDVNGTAPLGNVAGGVEVSGSGFNNVIGGVLPGEANRIAYNVNGGIGIRGGTSHTIRGNSIYENGGLGIDVAIFAFGTPYPNDPGDGDTGPNNLQNFPELTGGLATTTNTTIQGTLNSIPGAPYTIDFYANLAPDSTGSGEGRQYLGATVATTGPDSNAVFNVTLPVVAQGRYLSATATDTNGNTSDFSAPLTVPVTFAPTTFVVVTTNDSGLGSLRQAILSNNITPSISRNLISFNLPGAGAQIIKPLTELPGVIEPVTIDGYTQPGTVTNSSSNSFNATLRIRLQGSNLVNGLQLSGNSAVARGLMVNGFSYGLVIAGMSNALEGCVIGLDENGAPGTNFAAGVRVVSGGGNRIGGASPGLRNVVSGNFSYGVFAHLASSNLVIQGNFVGVGFSGQVARPNVGTGLYLQAAGNQIGGGSAGAGNVISGNLATGIYLDGSPTNSIQGNLIGTDATGLNPLPNGGEGIRMFNSPSNVVGGVMLGARNVISGNAGSAITIDSGSAQANRILGNFIGTDATGLLPLGNAYGIVTYTSFNEIGGNVAGAGNRIAYNASMGVWIYGFGAATNNLVRRNEIFANGGLGIDLRGDGVTLNDAGDADSGENQFQNYPVITGGTVAAGATTIAGTLNSGPGTTYTLDFFASKQFDLSGYGEGQQYIGSTNVTTDGGGNVNFNATFAITAIGRYVTATATDPFGNSSEFSAKFNAVALLPTVTLDVLNTNDAGAGSLRQALLDTDLNSGASNRTIRFNISGGGLQRILPASALPTPLESVTIDGFTQPGASPNTLTNGDNAVRLVQLSGVNSAAGILRFTAPGTIVRGLEITRSFSQGIELAGNGGVRIEGCLVYSNLAGAQGITINNSPGNVIGGTNAAQRNVISANSLRGVQISGFASSNNLVLGNFIGCDATGVARRPNGFAGVTVENAPFNIIGGGTAGARNLISGNSVYGVLLTGGGASNNLIQGNWIGLSAIGGPLSNSLAGIEIDTSASNNIVGAVLPAAGSRAGFTPFGLPATGEGNVIGYNGGPGFLVTGGSGNSVFGNIIFGNVGMSVDLGSQGRLANDANDADGGANRGQNWATLTGASISPGNTFVSGTFAGQALRQYVAEIYSSLLRRADGAGDAQFRLGTILFTTDGSGNANFSTTFPVQSQGAYVSGVISDLLSRDTSEIGPAFKASSTLSPKTFTVTTTWDDGPGSLRAAIQSANSWVASGPNNIAFNIAGAPPHEIMPQSPFDGFAGGVNVAAGDLDGDGKADIIISGGQVGPANGLTFQGSGNTISGVAVGDFTGDGFAFVESGTGNNLVTGNTFGLPGKPLTGVGVRFTGTGGGDVVTYNNFWNLGGAAVVAPGGNATRIQHNTFGMVGSPMIDRPGAGEPSAPFFITQIFSGPNLVMSGQGFGTSGQSLDIEILMNTQPLPGGIPVNFLTALVNSTGNAPFTVNLGPLLPNMVSVNALATDQNGNTSQAGTPDIFDIFEGFFGFNPLAVTDGNFESAGESGHPVSTFTGELYDPLPPDLNAGGPLPLQFGRYYASLLQRDSRMASRLGTNWLHNFEWRLTNSASLVQVISSRGRVIQFTNQSGNWVLMGRQDIPYRIMQAGTNFVLGDPNSKRLYTFSTNGHLYAIADGKGNAHTLAYTAGLLTTVSDGLGRTLAFQYSGAGFLTNVSDGARAVGFTQTNNNLATFRNALGFTTVYNYTNMVFAGSLMRSLTRPEGNEPYRQTFTLVGQVASQTHAGSNTTTYGYFATHTVITDSLTNTEFQVHSATGEETAFVDSADLTMNLGYNTNGQRNAIADREGNLIRLGYDAASRFPSSITNADGTVTRFIYSSRVTGGVTFYDLSQVVFPDGATESFAYDSGGNILTRTDRAGQLWRFGYNGRGQMLAMTNPAGGVMTFAYNANGTLASAGDTDIGTTQFLYDGLSRMTNVLHPDGTSARVTFDLEDRMVSATDERGFMTFFAYDGNNRLTNVTDAAGQSMRFAYDNADRLVKTTDRRGFNAWAAFDRRNQILSITNQNGNVTTFGYDPRRRMVTRTDGEGQTWNYGYDNESLLTSTTTPMGDMATFGYDAMGYLSRMTNDLGQAEAYARDAMKRVTQVLDGAGRTNSFGHNARGELGSSGAEVVGTASYQRDVLGNITQLTDLNGGNWRFKYSPMGRLLSLADPLNRTNRFEYDLRGRMQRTVFADGTTRTNIYDASGNMARAQYSAGPDYQYTWNHLNRLTNAGDLTLAYDADGRVTNTVNATGSYGARYDAGGRLTNITYLNGAFTVTYMYDKRDRLVGVTDSLTGTHLDLVYDEDGQLIGITRPNGVNSTYTYDGPGRLTRIQDGSISDLQFTVNEVGEVTSANYTMPLDPATYIGSSISNWTYDAAHQITSAGFGYDTRGRLTAAPGRTFSWNGAGQLTAIGSTTLGYNGLGELQTRTSGGTTTRYFYNYALGLTPIMTERNDTAGQVVRHYVWTPGGRLLYIIEAGAGNAVRFCHFDRVGSTLALTDGAGAVTDAWAYSPYGDVLARTGTSTQPFTFIGQFGVRAEPAAGLYQMRARYFDPATGRFLSRDPVWPRIRNARTLDPYEYAVANPLLNIDPTGECEGAESVLDGFLGGNIPRQPKPGEMLAPTGLNIAAPSATSARPPCPAPPPPSAPGAYVVSENMFVDAAFEKQVELDQSAAKWGPLSPLVAPFAAVATDGAFFGINDLQFEGRQMLGGNLNYYTQGQVWSTYGAPKGVMIMAIYAWKAVVYRSAPAPVDLEMANRGYDLHDLDAEKSAIKASASLAARTDLVMRAAPPTVYDRVDEFLGGGLSWLGEASGLW